MRALIVSVRGAVRPRTMRSGARLVAYRHSTSPPGRPRRDRIQCHASSRLEHVVISQQTALATMREVVALWYVGHRTAADVVYSACDLLVARPEHQ